jgi:hypothetical protein
MFGPGGQPEPSWPSSEQAGLRSSQLDESKSMRLLVLPLFCSGTLRAPKANHPHGGHRHAATSRFFVGRASRVPSGNLRLQAGRLRYISKVQKKADFGIIRKFRER